MRDQIESILHTVFVPIHRDGWRFVAIFALVAIILGQIAPFGLDRRRPNSLVRLLLSRSRPSYADPHGIDHQPRRRGCSIGRTCRTSRAGWR